MYTAQNISVADASSLIGLKQTMHLEFVQSKSINVKKLRTLATLIHLYDSLKPSQGIKVAPRLSRIQIMANAGEPRAK